MIGIRRLRFAVLPAVLSVAVHAHAILASAVPAAGQVVQGPEISIRLRFNSRIDGKRSRVLLVAPGGATSVLSVTDRSAPDTLETRANKLKAGSYTIRWQVLANDGHITRGEIPFRVQ
jgi:copper resistance protein C